MNRLSIGKFECFLLQTGTFRIDGGAMFGVVPKVLWEKKAEPDELNRVELTVNSLLIVGPDHRVLVDPGIGEREFKKFEKHYAIQGLNRLESELSAAGVSPREIDLVINTHLHWDHSGANLRLLPDGRLAPAFAQAAYFVQSGEWEAACHASEFTRAGYIFQDDRTLIQSGQMQLLQGDAEIIPGVRVIRTPGHTPFHQSVIVESGGDVLFYAGDLMPTASHLPLPYITALDLEPEVTLMTKKRILKQARSRGWILAFAHEPARKFLKLADQER